jgi:hypothetical protein
MDDPLPPKKTRIVNLDVMRGFFVSLALLQHFAYYWNIWFIDHFKDAGMGIFSYYKDQIGERIYLADNLAFHLLVFFTPWVSQVYLSLAAFNLARRTQGEFKKVHLTKIKIFLMLFCFFFFENFFVAATFGEAISFYPLMCWMVVLTLISLFYRKFGINGVIILFLISFIPWFWSEVFIMGDRLERFMRYAVHPYFEYDARLEYFLPSGCLGFLLGHLHFHKQKWGIGRYLVVMGVGVLLISIYNVFGEPFTLNRFDILATEHDQSETLFGTMRILGINSLVISLALLLQQKGMSFGRLKPLRWIGVNSLLIFGLHRILFVHLIAPIRVYLGAELDWPIYPSFFQELSHLIIVCLIVLIIKKSNILSLFGKA